MKAIIQKGRIRVKPVPTTEGMSLLVWLKKPMTDGNAPFVTADILPRKKFYELPCPVENITGVMIRPTETLSTLLTFKT